MMNFIVGLLTVVLVLNCVILILLILIQLPKKEAGAGIAFGGGATDALFGAGSGTALTNITKYSTALFLGLSLLLSTVNAHRASDRNSNLLQQLQKKAGTAPAATPGLMLSNANASATSTVPVLQLTTGATNIDLTVTNPPAAPK